MTASATCYTIFNITNMSTNRKLSSFKDFSNEIHNHNHKDNL